MLQGREHWSCLSGAVDPPLFVSTGSTSSDTFLAPVLAELRQRGWGGQILGVGGTALRDVGVDLAYDTTRTSAVGIAAGLFALGNHAASIWRAYRQVAEFLRRARPALMILVDNPGLNLRLLSLADRCGIRVLYYVCPEVWSLWRWELRAIAQKSTLIAAIFRSQATTYRQYGANVRWVGHPALDLLADTAARSRVTIGHAPTIGLFPGSRRHELIDLLPVLRGAAEIIRQRLPQAQFVMCSANEVADQLIGQHLRTWNVPVELLYRQPQTALARCDILLTCSGTATLEAAIMGIPMVVMYRLHHLLDWYIQFFVFRKLKHRYIALPNVLLRRDAVPELHQDEASPQRVASEALALLQSTERRSAMQEALAEVRRVLGSPGAIGKTADLIEELLGRRSPGEQKVRRQRAPFRKRFRRTVPSL